MHCIRRSWCKSWRTLWIGWLIRKVRRTKVKYRQSTGETSKQVISEWLRKISTVSASDVCTTNRLVTVNIDALEKVNEICNYLNRQYSNSAPFNICSDWYRERLRKAFYNYYRLRLENELLSAHAQSLVFPGDGSRIFPRGVRQLPKVLLFFNFFWQKLHENERIWTHRGRASLAIPPWIRQCSRQLVLAFCDSKYFTEESRRDFGRNIKSRLLFFTRFIKQIFSIFVAKKFINVHIFFIFVQFSEKKLAKKQVGSRLLF